MTILAFDEITKTEPGEEPARHQEAHRRAQHRGRITTRHIGGGHKRKIRARRLPAREVRHPGQGGGDRVRPEPLRADRAALLPGRGEAIHPRAPRASRSATPSCRGRAPTSCPATRCRSGPSRPARTIHNVELQPGKGGQLCRSAGTGAQLVAKEGEMRARQAALRRDPADPLDCMATIGQVGNLDHENVSVGKAGRADGWGSARRCAARR